MKGRTAELGVVCGLEDDTWAAVVRVRPGDAEGREVLRVAICVVEAACQDGEVEGPYLDLEAAEVSGAVSLHLPEPEVTDRLKVALSAARRVLRAKGYRLYNLGRPRALVPDWASGALEEVER